MRGIAFNYKRLRTAKRQGDEWCKANIGAMASSDEDCAIWDVSKPIDFHEKILYNENLNSGVAQSAERVAVNH